MGNLTLEDIAERAKSPSPSILAPFKPVALVYCDYIAAVAREALSADIKERDGYLRHVGSVQYDVKDDKLISTKKTLYVTDRNGKRYRITVEEETV